ncbi:MAG: hypothetical protein REI94_02975 [Moraxellaceae bacterium]|nr:hypothetical protein [Moraxellaceae bacterium]
MALIPCPECSGRISSLAAACPHCGYPLPKPAGKPGWSATLGDIRRVGFWVMLFMSLPTLATPALLNKLFAGGMLDGEGMVSMGRLILLTAPLCAAVALYGIALLRGWLDWEAGAVPHLLSVFGLLALGSVLNALFNPQAPVLLSQAWQAAAEHSGLTQIVAAVVFMLFGYLKAWGSWPFLSSLVVGGFLAWVWARKLLPQLMSR